MAELTPLDRLQPCLLTRLTDDEPDTQRESRERRVVSLAHYREAVLRDLTWLFNTGVHPERDHLQEFGEVLRSVLNFGISDLSGQTASGVNPSELERRIVQAIQTFEPRILPETLRVRVIVDEKSMSYNAVSFEVEGELWAQPMPDHLYLKTEFDLETGECRLKNRPDG